ncbi:MULTISPECIES: dermonecrotic toxin domain-containing protein [unclassified Pseudomonas]|uniref:dermonecrotic toxin domain-containing protein n=1 Tax=unclassified Pseudomonas TaxID=196821 RepID=UPI000C86CE82|nr:MULTISPECIES: DUF6543 domain-containing protein [unclassified Pseudomonas]PMV21204.1 hypothetical protein C1X17_17880 [Pseudomonas sp. FW305-3-2-15-C-TSA2]PMV25728.1 hypothetical protein C1X22_19605 [Pseudomonas sp. DP16D-L5]PMV37971.1 hypothetical protein C1X21_17230 [Pseudomonas sp. FW305-3-2-15-A-LB2]PMV44374.1 hypothetical protein C1X16_17540 [Pseudomonas sp. FW305-3-2-15-C-R2A1]PMV45146.1 hypothetical protein C1X18_25235 [Pseudomonas sp. FW305-3-2-15-C-LB1]
MPVQPPAPAANPTRQAIAAQFLGRPTLRTVTAQMLGTHLVEKYPPLTLPVADLRLAVPREGGGRALLPLLDVALDHIADGSFPELTARQNLDCYLSDATGTRLGSHENGERRDFDLRVIEALIRELPRVLFIGFQEALAAYWGQDSDAGSVRWKWLADVLQGVLLEVATRQTGLAAQHIEILSALNRYPDRASRTLSPAPANEVHAYTLETHLQRAGKRLTVQGTEILVVRGKQALLFRLNGEIQTYPDLETFGQAWGEQLQQRFMAERITWQQYEPDGNIFEVQAALILNQQLDDLATLQLPAQSTRQAVERLFAVTTDPAQWLAPSNATSPATVAAIQAALPDHLQATSAANRLAYRHTLLENASLKRQTLGDADFDSLETLRGYATAHVNQQLCMDRAVAQGGLRACTHEALATGYDAGDLELTFHVPVGILEGGYVEPVVMNLVDLALKNLSGRPKGRMTIRHVKGRAIEAWLTPDYLLQLVQRVDIGKNYPAYLRRELMGQTEAARKRQRLFEQLRPLHLKTQALERLIKGEAGLTQRGFECVKALVNPNPLERRVNVEDIVIRPLAFVRKPGATADVVRNMFVIEPRDTQSGPHLLYRPAYAEALLEYPNRQQLLAAIVQPGDLQESVLTWLPDQARAVYSNGGFNEPHYVRIGMGSEFDNLPSVPKPAELAGADDESNDEIGLALRNGSLMEYLFGSETQQLVDQAERESTSNSESRWALILEGLQLGFNTLLLVVRGPMAAVGWLMQAMHGVVKDLPALESADPTARELAWIDLLLNIGMAMLHHGSTGASHEESQRDEQATIPLPFKHPLPGQRLIRPAVVERGAVGLPSEPPGGGRTLLDFDRSLAGDGASAALFERLRAVNVPWPTPAPEPVNLGPYRGLYKINDQWHASVGGLLFRVNIVPGFGEVFIIHPLKPDHPGIKLKTDGNGHWTLDRGLKLQGGGRKRLQELRHEKQLENERLKDRLLQLAQEAQYLMVPIDQAGAQLASALKGLEKQLKTLRIIQDLLLKASQTQRPDLEIRQQTEISEYKRLRNQFGVLLQHLETQLSESLPVRFELATLTRQLEAAAIADLPLINASTILKELWNQQLFLHKMQLEALDFHTATEAGEPLAAWHERMQPRIVAGDLTLVDENLRMVTGYIDYLEHMAAHSATMEATLQHLGQASAAARAVRQELLAGIPIVELFFSDNLKLSALELLASLSQLRFKMPSSLSALQWYYKARYQVCGLDIGLKSHIEVRSSTEYPLAEQRNVYETVLDKYQQAEFALRALKTLKPDALGPEAERVLKGLEFARALAQNELEAVVREQEDLKVELPLSKTLRAKPPAKRVFKTRKKEYLIGEFKPADAHNGEEHITITDTLLGKTLASYNQHTDGWAPIDEATTSTPAPQLRSLATLKSEAQGLIGQRQDLEQLVAADQAKLDNPLTRQDANPGEWDTLLNAQAEKLTQLANEIKRDHLDAPTAQNLIDECLAQAKDINRWAQRICSDAYKRQWPTMESVAYLWDHQQIDINLTSQADPQRPTLSGDFFTEYAVYDKAQKPPVVLWYAHFHYATADAPPDGYTRAHLKLPEQRKLTQKDLLKAHVQDYLSRVKDPGSEPVTKIVYVLITPPLDNLFLKIAPKPKGVQA